MSKLQPEEPGSEAVPSEDQPVSDAALGALILGQWERILLTVAGGPRLNRRLAARCGVPVSAIEHVRDTRNEFAHSGKAARSDLEGALAIIRRIERNLSYSITANGDEDGRSQPEALPEPQQRDSGGSDHMPSRLMESHPPTRQLQPHVAADVDGYRTPANPEDSRQVTRWSSSLRLADWLDILAEHWIGISVTVLSIVVIIVILANFGVVGLVATPLVIIGAFIILRVVCWFVAVGSLIYAIMLFAQGNYLQGLLFLGLSGVAGAIGALTND